MLPRAASMRTLPVAFLLFYFYFFQPLLSARPVPTFDSVFILSTDGESWLHVYRRLYVMAGGFYIHTYKYYEHSMARNVRVFISDLYVCFLSPPSRCCGRRQSSCVFLCGVVEGMVCCSKKKNTLALSIYLKLSVLLISPNLSRMFLANSRAC